MDINLFYYDFQSLNIACVFLSLATYFIKSFQTRIVSDPKKIKAKRKTQSTSYNSEVNNLNNIQNINYSI